MADIELTDGADENGLALMMATLIRQNLEDHPDREADLAKMHGRIAIIAFDAEIALTLECRGGRVRVHDGVVGIPDLTIRAEAEVITDLSRMEDGPLGLPDPRGEVNRSLVDAVRRGGLKIYGLPLAFPLLTRLGHVLAID